MTPRALVARLVQWYQQRRLARAWRAMTPQQQLRVFASLLQRSPSLRNTFRRALAMQDASSQERVPVTRTPLR